MEGLFMSCAGIITLLVLWIRRKKYNYSYKDLFFVVLGPGMLAYFGAAFASKLAFNYWAGFRFYGKPLFLLLGTYLSYKYCKGDCEKMLNYFFPADLAALAVMKVGCLTSGCCAGILITMPSGIIVRFPSQIVELIFAVLMLALMLYMEHRQRNYRGRYYWYMIIYGLSRFVFEFLRVQKGKKIDLQFMELSVGHLFCIATVIVGAFMLAFIHQKEKRSTIAKQQDK